jgi:pilus assembly protein CpaB
MNLHILDRLPFKYSKTWIVLGVALAIGTVAALAARSFLSAQVEAIEARAKGKTVELIVAKADIAQGAKLSSSNLAVRHVPVEYAHSTAIPPSGFERIDGQTIAYSIKSGEIVLWGLMESKKVPTFSARVESGHRAMTVPVDEINSISGMLEPEDLIDLIESVERDGHRTTFPLLQQVRVMATGQRSIDDPKTGERRQYSTVTLDTTLAQAQSIIAAREAGKLTALLRNPQDRQTIRTADSTPAKPSGRKAGGIPSARTPKHQVPILYGGNVNAFAPDALKLGRDTSPVHAPLPHGSAPVLISNAQ